LHALSGVDLVRGLLTAKIGSNIGLNYRGSGEILEMAVNELGMRGLKLHPGFQNFSPNDQRIYPLIRKAAN
jgi:predicted TIM-barrel fold metal-dependent hydrolase